MSIMFIICLYCTLFYRRHFHYSVEGEYLALTSDGDYATIPVEYDMLACVFTREHMCQIHTALYPTENVSWCLYVLFINDAE